MLSPTAGGSGPSAPGFVAPASTPDTRPMSDMERGVGPEFSCTVDGDGPVSAPVADNVKFLCWNVSGMLPMAPRFGILVRALRLLTPLRRSLNYSGAECSVRMLPRLTPCNALNLGSCPSATNVISAP